MTQQRRTLSAYHNSYEILLICSSSNSSSKTHFKTRKII
nr:MAG TPA: hypothetical protein [Caudoviricetes sp.]